MSVQAPEYARTCTNTMMISHDVRRAGVLQITPQERMDAVGVIWLPVRGRWTGGNAHCR